MRKTRRGTSKRRAHADQRAAPDRAVHAPVTAAAPRPEGAVARHVILFLAANPVETERLALDREERAIRDALTRSRHRERFSLETRWAVQPQDLLGELRALRPSVLQFSGHGRRAEAAAQLHARAGEPRERDVAVTADAGASGLYLHDAGDGMHVVSPAALAAALAASQAPVRLAIVSACSTAGFADALLPHVECAIDMTGAIRDDAARSFAAALYGALGDQASVAAAFDQALAAISVGGLPGAYVPRLCVRDGVDPTALVLAATPPVLRRSLPCPYPGLRPYSARDPGFQGRDREIREVLAALRDGERAIYLRGRSGSGKSSLMAAGLLPRLKDDAAGLGPFVVRELRPGEQPAARLAQALSTRPGERLIVAERVAALLRRRARCASVLVVVDQLEELFTLAIAAEREQFIAAMRELRDEPRCVVICALRSDFTAELKHSRLWIDRGGRMPLIDIDPLGGDALRRAIIEPAASLGVTVEPQLVERLLADAGGQPGTTPLIQETLVRLWDERTDQTLRLADYEALGADDHSGLAVALAGRANAAVRRLGPAHLAIARRILLRLVSFGEDHDDTRRQQPRSKLRAASDDARAFDGVLDQLIAARVLTADDAGDGDPRVDLGHEVVITAWPLLTEWVDAHRGDEQRRRELEAAAARWVANGRGARGLLDEIDLGDAEQWRHGEAARLLGGPSRELGDLIAASSAALARQRVRRRRMLAGACAALAALLLIVTALAAAAQHRGRRAIAGEQRVRELLARSYAETGRKLIVDGHPQEAMPYLVEARRGGEDGPALRMLVRIAKRHLPLLPPLVHLREIASAGLSPDGTRLATAAWDHTARVWDTTTGEPTTPPLEHMNWLVGVAFSPDGRRLVTSSLDDAARIWDTATGELLATLLHAKAVFAAVFSPDGALVLTACGDRTAQIWDAATGRPTTGALVHTGDTGSVAFSADGSRALTTSHDGAAYLWKVDGGALIARFAQGHVASAAFSSDGGRVVTASTDGTVRIWSATGELVASLAQGGLGSAAFDLDVARRLTASVDGAIHLAAGPGRGELVRAGFSPDGARIVTADPRGAVHVWNATAGNLIAGPLAHPAEVVRAGFSPDGARLYTASADGAVRTWDAITGRALPGPFAHHGEVTGAAFSPDGTRLVTASKDGTARVWDAATGRPITGPLAHHGEVTSAVFSPDGAWVATTSGDRTARVWSAATGAPITEPLEHRGRVGRAAFSRDGARIVTVSDDFTARVWDAATGEPLTLPLEHQDFISAAVFTPDGVRVITASHDRLVRIWDAGVDQPAPRPLAHPESVGSAAFNADGTRIVTTSGDKAVRIWNAATGALVACPLQHEGSVTSAAFSPDDKRLVTACEDGAARVIDAASGDVIAGFAHRAWVMSAAFSPDGTRVVTASMDNTAQVWNAATGKPVGAPLEHRGPVWRAAFSPDGTRVVTAAFDSTARVWDAATGAPITGPLEHQAGVIGAAFSPDGTRVVTTGGWTAQVWDAAAGRRIATLVHDDKVAVARFSPDGTRVITASDDRVARVWNAATGQLIVSLLHHERVVDAAFSPDGARVATASWDRSARVWDAATGNLLARFEHNGIVVSARFSADGGRLVTASADQTARVWDVGLDAGTLDDWIAAAARSPFILVRGALVRRPPR